MHRRYPSSNSDSPRVPVRLSGSLPALKKVPSRPARHSPNSTAGSSSPRSPQEPPFQFQGTRPWRTMPSSYYASTGSGSVSHVRSIVSVANNGKSFDPPSSLPIRHSIVVVVPTVGAVDSGLDEGAPRRSPREPRKMSPPSPRVVGESEGPVLTGKKALGHVSPRPKGGFGRGVPMTLPVVKKDPRLHDPAARDAYIREALNARKAHAAAVQEEERVRTEALQARQQARAAAEQAKQTIAWQRLMLAKLAHEAIGAAATRLDRQHLVLWAVAKERLYLKCRAEYENIMNQHIDVLDCLRVQWRVVVPQEIAGTVKPRMVRGCLARTPSAIMRGLRELHRGRTMAEALESAASVEFRARAPLRAAPREMTGGFAAVAALALSLDPTPPYLTAFMLSAVVKARPRFRERVFVKDPWLFLNSLVACLAKATPSPPDLTNSSGGNANAMTYLFALQTASMRTRR